MSEFKIDDYVQHINMTEWGTGKIISPERDGKYDVFFEAQGKKTMQATFLKPAEKANSVILDEVSSETDFSKSSSISDVISYFLRLFPEGFETQEYREHERDYKVDASNFMNECLGKTQMDALLHDKNYSKIWEQAKRVVQKTNLIFPQEKMALTDAINASPEREEEFSKTLYELLHGDNTLQARFTKFSNFLGKYGALKWTTATYFLFLADPNKYAFMKPMVMDKAAAAFSYPLNRTKDVDWATYSRLIDLYDYIQKYLIENTSLKPHDMIDVQSFIWCADPKSYDKDGQKEVYEERQQRLSVD